MPVSLPSPQIYEATMTALIRRIVRYLTERRPGTRGPAVLTPENLADFVSIGVPRPTKAQKRYALFIATRLAKREAVQS